MATEWHIGTMGFGYKQWVGSFYPAGMQSKHFLPTYAERFDAVEIDSTFYGSPRAELVQRWAQQTPDSFKFCLKTPRQITHDAPLAEGHELMHQFIEVSQVLSSKLGCILIQFGPGFTAQALPQLQTFVEQLPTAVRFAVEFRHRSWLQTDVSELLQAHQMAWVGADYIHLPKLLTLTTDFVYLRFIGPHGRYQTKDVELVDTTPDLKSWQVQIDPHLEKLKAVFAFFNNDFSGYSPATANRFRQLVGLPVKEIRPPQQGRLFD